MKTEIKKLLEFANGDTFPKHNQKVMNRNEYYKLWVEYQEKGPREWMKKNKEFYDSLVQLYSAKKQSKTINYLGWILFTLWLPVIISIALLFLTITGGILL